MRAWTRFCLVVCGVAASVAAIYAFQREFRVYISLEGYDNIPLPEDYRVPGEFVFGRLMYPPHPRGRFSFYRWALEDVSIGAKAAPVGRRIIRAPIASSLEHCAA